MYLISKRDQKGGLLSARVEVTLLKAQERGASLAFGGDFTKAFSRRMNRILTWNGMQRLSINGVTLEVFE